MYDIISQPNFSIHLNIYDIYLYLKHILTIHFPLSLNLLSSTMNILVESLHPTQALPITLCLLSSISNVRSPVIKHLFIRLTLHPLQLFHPPLQSHLQNPAAYSPPLSSMSASSCLT
jgi:hypothetical protein